MEPTAIQITTEPHYLADRSAPDEQHYVFAYTITIRNTGRCRVQLLGRRWVITDGNGKITEVEGSGVIGEQPLIPPGEHYTYTSGVSLETPFGVMQGNYTMLLDDGREFQAAIDPFRLALPNIIN